MGKGATDVVGCSTEDLHQDVFVGARPLHGLSQLLHGVDDGRVQHGEDGLLELPRQLLLQHVHQLLSPGRRFRIKTPESALMLRLALAALTSSYLSK